jgi:hypothetical protein
MFRMIEDNGLETIEARGDATGFQLIQRLGRGPLCARDRGYKCMILSLKGAFEAREALNEYLEKYGKPTPWEQRQEILRLAEKDERVEVVR